MTTPNERKVKVKIENLSLSFGGVKALDNVSIDIYENEIIAIIGPNGAGKTTLIRLMASLLLPTNGSITFAGFDTVRDAAEMAKIALSDRVETRVHVPFVTTRHNNPVDLDVPMPRTQFEALTGDLVERSLSVVRSVFEAARLLGLPTVRPA